MEESVPKKPRTATPKEKTPKKTKPMKPPAHEVGGRVGCENSISYKVGPVKKSPVEQPTLGAVLEGKKGERCL